MGTDANLLMLVLQGAQGAPEEKVRLLFEQRMTTDSRPTGSRGQKPAQQFYTPHRLMMLKASSI